MDPRERIYGEATSLGAWHHLVKHLLATHRPRQALRLLPVILAHYPTYLHGYMQTLQALWLTRRWQEGKGWALRMLRADPTQELAWAMLANAAEEEGRPAQALHYWRLGFEQSPYNRLIRAGVVRTSLGQTPPLMLNRAALASIYRQGERWDRAIPIYRALVVSNPKRPDFQLGLLQSLWQQGDVEEALPLARSIVQQEPEAILGWVVCAEIGNASDLARAETPLAALDVDGIYTRLRFGLRLPTPTSQTIEVTGPEAALFTEIRHRFGED